MTFSMTLAEARKNGIPELGIKNECPLCLSGNIRETDGVEFIHGIDYEFRIGPHGHYRPCTAPSDDAIFAALWAEREQHTELDRDIHGFLVHLAQLSEDYLKKPGRANGINVTARRLLERFDRPGIVARAKSGGL